jgi:universal stress protein E
MRPGSDRSDPWRARTLFENVLVCGSRLDAPILLRYAQPVLEAGEATVRLLELPEPARLLRPPAGAPLERVAETLERRGVTVRREAADDASSETIIRQAGAAGHDLVITGVALAPHGRRALERLDLDLIRRCPCPIWALECNEPRPLRRVLAALGPALDDEVEVGRAVRVASAAAAVAAAGAAELDVMHAWTAYGAHLLRPRMPPDDVAAYVKQARESARDRLTRVFTLAGIAPAAGAVHFDKGDFQPVLSRVVEDRDIDLVVMGTRGRRGWLDSVIRPHAESVLAQLRPSVLVIK